MENLAHAFDQPIESREYQTLAATARDGGPVVVLRYWLGRLLRRNFFRESDDARLAAAIREMLMNPERTDSELAAIARTTEKQIARMTDVFLLRKLWKLQTSDERKTPRPTDRRSNTARCNRVPESRRAR